jgi:hypothetical protein
MNNLHHPFHYNATECTPPTLRHYIELFQFCALRLYPDSNFVFNLKVRKVFKMFSELRGEDNVWAQE